MLLKTYKRLLTAKLLSLITGTLLLGRYGMQTNSSLNMSADGSSTIIILDLSASMNIVDMPGGVNRLDYAKSLIEDYVSTNSATPVGLIAFNENIELLIPPTQDYKIYLQKLLLLHTRSLEDVAGQGSEGDRYYQVLNYALAQKDNTTSFIFLSDFNSNESQKYTSSYLSTLHKGSSFSFIGVGTTDSHQILDANGKTLPQQAVGRNDSLGKSFASALNGAYHINPPHVIAPLARSHNVQPHSWIVRIATLLLLLGL